MTLFEHSDAFTKRGLVQERKGGLLFKINFTKKMYNESSL